ncbi:pyruvate kinase [Buchnera aphidicola (Ceratoglyphina bambusae)]|uniref:pyruvate kinase n=1 Tax=Buchnera aphidicola TaxID=9 RepID=UPI0031B802FB
MSNILKKTKIVATMGPSIDNIKILKSMVINGVNVFRLNFSHGNKNDHIRRVKMIFYLRKKLNCNIGILGDLQGPKIRITKFKKEKVFLRKNSIFILDYSLKNKLGSKYSVGINYKNLYKDLSVGDILLLDDGRISLKVKLVKLYKIITIVLLGGFLSDNKGINKLGGGLSASSITSKDKKDIIFSIKLNLDYIAVSFPKSYKDIEKVRKLINLNRSKIKIVAKIERAEVIENDIIMNKIIIKSDAIMVARGDLGVEIGESKLAKVQKKIIKNSIKFNRTVITATQMMESMIKNPFPTRAEVMDISNSILDGTDAIMLSAETATGKYPIESILYMNKICKGVEKICIKDSFKKKNKNINYKSEKIILSSVINLANSLNNISAILTTVEYKSIYYFSSKILSQVPIFYFSSNSNILNIMTLCKGIFPIYFKKTNKNLNSEKMMISILLKNRFVKKNDFVIFLKFKNKRFLKNNNYIKFLKI